MSGNAFEPNKIAVVLQGLMVLFTKSDTQCVIGLLRDAPPRHNRKIHILERSDGGEFKDKKLFENAGAEGTFNLNVQNAVQTKIEKRDAAQKIDRDKDERLDSFNWLLDFDRDFPGALPSPPVGAKGPGFMSMVTLDNGEIYTRVISENYLQFQPPRSDWWFHVGKVAVEMGIKIQLDSPQSKAVFTKTGEPGIELPAGQEYLIRIERADEDDAATGRDIECYFGAIGTAPGFRPLSFRSVPPLKSSPPSTPDATCPVTGLGETPPP